MEEDDNLMQLVKDHGPQVRALPLPLPLPLPPILPGPSHCLRLCHCLRPCL